MSALNPALVLRVRRRARGRCEYCRTAEQVAGEEFTVDHIVPRSKGGTDRLSNLALCCFVCNPIKGNRTMARDPLTGSVVSLFNPRRRLWAAHFTWTPDGLRIVGRTPVGRATVTALRLNRATLLVARQAWVSWGIHPPR
jgi:hypothetical protein